MIEKFMRRFFKASTDESQIKPISPQKTAKRSMLGLAAFKIGAIGKAASGIKPPDIAPGVVPKGVLAPVLAMDSPSYSPYMQSAFDGQGQGFPGFQHLAFLATRPEYRAIASAISTEMTRKGIELTSKQDDGGDTGGKLAEIEAEMSRLEIISHLQKAVEHDCLYGRGQLLLKIQGADLNTPLILSGNTVAKGAFKGVSAIDAVWTTPSAYNALDPSAEDFYRPSGWFMLGQQVHASRLITVTTRPLPDILKPAYNFAGISLSQLAEPYVENWLRTRQSVSDLINKFSITALKTAMDQVLDGDDDGGENLINRAKLFAATRSNLGLMLLDQEREDIVQVNTPLGGLHELQAQAQEHMCSVSKVPAIILTGISPSGLNASSEGEIRVFYDWISAQQEAFWRKPLKIIIDLIQLSLYGEIDPDIGFKFKPLYQLSEKEEMEIKEAASRVASAYIDRGVIDPSEERMRLARDKNSGYQGIDADDLPTPDEVFE